MMMPYPRWESFNVCGNADGTFHILVVSGDGGYIFADRIETRDEAEWAAEQLNRGLRSKRRAAP